MKTLTLAVLAVVPLIATPAVASPYVATRLNAGRDALGLAELTVPESSCAGDCNHDGVIRINELILCVNIGLDIAPVTECMACDANDDGSVHIDELILAVDFALSVCPYEPQACGGPLDVACPQGEFCELPAGTCHDPEQIGSCTEIPDACPEIFAPVCGCDGVTYDNDCFRQAAGVSKDFDGDCAAPPICAGIGGLPCDAGEVCDLRDPSCRVADLAGTCVPRPDACPKIYDPVCACGDVTYSNDCLRLRDGAILAYVGECDAGE